MLDQKTGIPKSAQPLLPGKSSNTLRQRRLMLAALLLLLVSLTAVLYRDRDFWFPDAEQADDVLLSPPQVQDTRPNVPAPAVVPQPPKKMSEARKKKQPRQHEAGDHEAGDKEAPVRSDPASSDGPTITATRTVLPPLEVEVVAGDAHRTVRPGTNAVHVDLQRATSGPSFASATPDPTIETPARVAAPLAQRTSATSNAAASLVSHSVQPNYPLLARQMKVQGSVILQALIGRDGMIQDLRILSGPKILAAAAEEAVRQWHFKPHLVGAEPVETKANITVNFTISTN